MTFRAAQCLVQPLRRGALFISLVSACDGSAEQSALQPELVSPLGSAYFSRPDTAGSVEAADSFLNGRPNDIDAMLGAAEARASIWRYREAIALYDSAIALQPNDWRPWRFRGHRHISLRQFDRAVRDLERARELDSLSFDVAYHLGLARYLQGDWNGAAEEYARCMDLAQSPQALTLAGSLPSGFRACTNMATVDNDRVAMTEWRWRALIRAGREQDALRLLERIHADMNIGTNVSYHALLLFHKGERAVEEIFDTTNIGDQFETIGYGVAVQWLVEGDTVGALELMRRIVDRGERWQAFGFIAAEADLVRFGFDAER